MDSSRQPGEVKPRTVESPGGPPPATAARRYPKPPALWQRFILFNINPETWPTAARYPTRFTLIVLALAIILGAASAGIGDGIRLAQNLDGVAKSYATAYPAAPLEISTDGLIKPTPAYKEPILFSLPPLHVMIDPTCKTNPDSIKTLTALITDHECIYCGTGAADFHWPLGLEKADQATPITGEWIGGKAPLAGFCIGFGTSLLLALGNLLWAVLMMFLLCPLIMLVASAGERGLILPKRAAYRMAAAFLVPLVLFSGLMHAAGYSIVNILGPDFGMMFWFFTAAGIAVWTGILARHQFGPPAKRKTN